jgi:exodeoxyribonuclease VII small subunit
VTDEAEWESLGFEAALERLEQMVGQLESGRLGLDQALARYQLGVQLLGHCYRLLEGAERSVALITGLDAEGNPQTVPFDATATADRETPPERTPKVTHTEPDDDDIDDDDIDDDESPPF